MSWQHRISKNSGPEDQPWNNMAWPRWTYILRHRLRSIFQPSTVEQELNEELSFHLEHKLEEGVDKGFDAHEAHYRALRAMGGLEQRKEEIRDMRRVRWFSDFAADLRYAIRSIGQSKLFTALIVLTLGLGIGANSAIFSLADALLLRPLPVLRPSEVVTLSSLSPGSSPESSGPFSYRDYVDVRDKATSFEGLAGYTWAINLGFASRRGELTKLTGGAVVTGNLFRVMGIKPELGRDFNTEEDRVPGRNAVVVLGNNFWQTQFNGDRSVVGRRILLNGVEFEIIGVAPKEFFGLDPVFRPDMFVPIMMWPRLSTTPDHNPLDDRGDHQLTVKGRLKPNVPISQARAEVRVIAENLQRTYPKTNHNQEISVLTEFALRLKTDATDATLTWVLLALAAAVLLIACANVASLLLGRAGKRSREIAVRLAIGASRFRLIRLLMVETLVIALLGGVVGIALGYGGVVFFGGMHIPTDLPISLSIKLDRRVFFFSLLISFLSAFLCGLAPAVQSTRTNLITALKTADVDVPGRRRLWGRNTLVICQVAASVVLLTAAFQLTRAFQERWSGGPGFRTNHLLTMAFDPQLVRFSEAQTQTFYQELLRRARHLPGVKSAALTDHLPMSTEQGGIHVLPEGYQLPAGQDDVSVGLDVAGDGYFDTLGVKMLNGRAFDETDTTASTKVAIVNQQFAQHFWPNGSAIGKRFRLNNQNGPLVQIVGITKNAKYYWIGEPPVEYIYLPFTQRPQARMTLIVESQGPSASLAGSLRELVRNLDAGQPVFNVRTIEDFYQMRVITAPTMLIQTVSAMGLIGLILAIAGLYGLISYNASRRIREIGIRMAIGADAMSVLRMVLRQAVSLVGFGIGIGLLLGLLTERGLNAMFQATGIDVGSYLLILPALITVTMLAAFVPARKASRIEPSRALRYE